MIFLLVHHMATTPLPKQEAMSWGDWLLSIAIALLTWAFISAVTHWASPRSREPVSITPKQEGPSVT